MNIFNVLCDEEEEFKEENATIEYKTIKKYYNNYDEERKKIKKHINDKKEKNEKYEKKEKFEPRKITIKKIEDDIENIKLSDYYKVYTQYTADKVWNDTTSKTLIKKIEKWGDVPKFFNALKNNLSKTKELIIFIMKSEISPMWEDNENRRGNKLTVKINDLSECLDVMMRLQVYMCNNSLFKNYNDIITGLVLSPKLKETETYYIIQIWYKKRVSVQCCDSISNYLTSKNYSVKIRKIDPEF